jgi:hypothetical protein
MKQPSDGGKNVTFVWNMKERGYFEDVVLHGRIISI